MEFELMFPALCFQGNNNEVDGIESQLRFFVSALRSDDNLMIFVNFLFEDCSLPICKTSELQYFFMNTKLHMNTCTSEARASKRFFNFEIKKKMKMKILIKTGKIRCMILAFFGNNINHNRNIEHCQHLSTVVASNFKCKMSVIVSTILDINTYLKKEVKS